MKKASKHSATITRREMLRIASAAAVAGGMSRLSDAQMSRASGQESGAFPEKFLWGCATAGHQVEGNNISSDLWALEHLPQSSFKEPSGDACDHYHLYPQDISLLADLGFNSYRFSLEWSRIEPEEGFFSNAQLDHYRRMLAICRELNLTTLLTYSHYTVPRWFAVKGAWESTNAADRYARFCERATKHLGDLVGYASTMNEPDVPQLLNWIDIPGGPAGRAAALANIRNELHAPQFSGIFFGNSDKIRDGLLSAHSKGMEAMKSVRPQLPVGFNLAISDDQAASQDSHLEEKRQEVYAPWLEAARHCDYLGVQTYSRSIVGTKDMPPPRGAEVTQNGMEFYPECVEHVVRYASKEARVPIIVTENGIATDDDSRRVEYYKRALTGLKSAIDDGVDVRGYMAWSLLDNFEWNSGFTPKFGLVAVNLENQTRTIKPSGAMLGNIARKNLL